MMDGQRKESIYNEATIIHSFDTQNRPGQADFNWFHNLIDKTAEITDSVI